MPQLRRRGPFTAQVMHLAHIAERIGQPGLNAELAIELDALLEVRHGFSQFVVFQIELAQIVVSYGHAPQIADLVEQLECRALMADSHLSIAGVLGQLAQGRHGIRFADRVADVTADLDRFLQCRAGGGVLAERGVNQGQVVLR